MTYIHAVLLGVVEGLTEFLPISSTAHMILASRLMGVQQTEFVKFFEVFIQVGAIFAVVFLYFKKFLDFKLLKHLVFSFLPTAIVGFFLYKIIKNVFFESTFLIAGSLVLVGLLFILVEQRNNKFTKTIPSMSLMTAVLIGLAQSLAVIPGVSRAGIVMVAMMLMGYKRDESAQYSFMLALPTLAAAALYDAYKMRTITLTGQEYQMIAIGLITSFVVAYLSMKWFVSYLRESKLTAFGVYRIALGIISMFF